MHAAPLLLCTLIAQAPAGRPAKVPDVTAGPDLEREARPVEAPIAQVTVFSDRARIRRRAKVRLSAGIAKLRLPDLPGAVALDTIRVSASGARVLRVEAAPIERERYSIASAEKLLDERDTLNDAISLNEQSAAAERRELSFLSEIVAAQPVGEAARDGRAPLVVNPAAWFETLGFFRARRAATRERLRKLADARRDLDERHGQLMASISDRNRGGFSSRKVRVLVIAEASKGTRSNVELEYFIAGSSWRPAYDLRYHASRGELIVQTSAIVDQASGEDWADVKLALSTAIPGQGIELPELLTWTLGEKKDYVPRPRPRHAVKRPQLFAAPRPKVKPWERERQMKLAILQSRLQSSRKDRDLAPHRRSGRKNKKRSRPRPAPTPRPEPAPVAPIVRSEKLSVMADEAVMESDSVMSTAGEALGSLISTKKPRVQRTSMNLFEQSTARPRLTDPRLPAVAAGGLDYVYDAATIATVPSNSEKHRIPLGASTYPVRVFYEAAPALSKTAYMKATVNNTSGRPMLRGAMNIFLGSEFAGQGELRTTGPGGTIEFPLGADEDIRLTRKVLPTTRTEGVFSKDDVTTYVTEIEVGNYKRRPVRITVVDQLPKTNNDDIKVKLLDATPSPSKGADKQGLLRWNLDIAAGATKTIRFRYTIKRPAGWRLY